jgi:hypothetical protein
MKGSYAVPADNTKILSSASRSFHEFGNKKMIFRSSGDGTPTSPVELQSLNYNNDNDEIS